MLDVSSVCGQDTDEEISTVGDEMSCTCEWQSSHSSHSSIIVGKIEEEVSFARLELSALLADFLDGRMMTEQSDSDSELIERFGSEEECSSTEESGGHSVFKISERVSKVF
jgi:hypothetical protein